MRILFVQKEGGIFGAENYHLHCIPALLNRGLTVEFLRLYTNHQLGRDSEFVTRLSNMGVVVHQVNIGRFPGIADLREVARIILRGNFDIVHSHLIHADLYAALIKKIYNCSAVFVSTKHGYDNAYAAKYGFDPVHVRRTPYYWLSRWAESVMDKSYTISNGLRNFFIASGLTNGDKMELIYYGFDLSPLPEQVNASHYRVAKQQLCITGRLVAFKGHAWALKALSFLKEDYPYIRLVIIGTGKHQTELEKIAKEFGVSENVQWLGYRKDAAVWMHYSDVVLVPSKSEGFGVVFLEAFKSATPVVAFDVPAANELIANERNGLLAPPFDERALAACIDRLLKDKKLALQLTKQATLDLEQKFSLSTMVEATMQFYQRLLNR